MVAPGVRSPITDLGFISLVEITCFSTSGVKKIICMHKYTSTHIQTHRNGDKHTHIHTDRKERKNARDKEKGGREGEGERDRGRERERREKKFSF